MDARKIVLKHTAVMAIGQALCAAAMVAVFALLGKFSAAVLIGAVVGVIIAVGNHFFMAMVVCMAADKAEAGEVEQGKKMVSLSSTVRLFAMAAILLLGIKLGANVIALVLPLAFARPILMVAEFFGKKGD